MRISRVLTVVLALGLAAVAFVGLQGLSALAQGEAEPGPVVFASDRTGNYEIYVLDPETGLSSQLTNNPGDDVEPVWSPDRETVAFASNRDGDYEIYVMRADGSAIEQLTNNLAEDRRPQWQPEGTHLIFLSDVNGQWDVYVITADGAIVRQLTNDVADERGPGAEGAGLPPTLSPGVQVPTVGFTPVTPLGDATVINFQLNLRQNPGEGAFILEVLPQNTPLDIVGRYFDNSWIQARAPSGNTGWVLARLVDINIDLTTVPIVNAPFIAPPPTLTPTPAATATPVVSISFWSNKAEINAGECAIVGWDVEGIREVYFQDRGVTGHDSREVCPDATRTFHLRVVLLDGSVVDRYLTIVVK